LFITEWIRVDVVAILIMVALPLLGLIEGRETFQGFSSTAVISIIAVIIMGLGLTTQASSTVLSGRYYALLDRVVDELFYFCLAR
jgi:di/tricarboxylate transporter